MKFLYPLLVMLTLLGFSHFSNAQQKTVEILEDITAELNQDSLSSYILSMQNMGTRYALADNTKEVALWIKQKFESFGYQDVVLDSFLLNQYGSSVMQYNVICRSDSIYDHDDYVLLGAHHDAISSSPMDSTPGADDNASGVAGVLEIARVMKLHGQNTKIPFHYATWAAEELGLLGSEFYVDKYIQTDDLPLFYFNLDMIANSTNGNREVNATVTGGINYVLDIATAYSELVPINDPISGGSDHMPFNAEGVPILFFIESDFSEHYHSVNDRLEYLEMDYALEVVKGTAAAYYFGANANPLVEIRQAINGGNGDDLLITWELQEGAVSYFVDIFHNDELILTQETAGDSLYISGLPANENVCYELYSMDENGLGGFRMRRCIDLSETPDPLAVSSTMELNYIEIDWEDVLPLDASTVTIERKQRDESEFSFYNEVDADEGKIEIPNHETGIWEYQLSLKDNDGLVSDPSQTVVFSSEVKDDVMIVSGQLGGYGNPTHSDVLGFYEDIMPLKDYYLFSATIDKNYLPIMNNMEVLIWNAFSSNYSEFYENFDIIKAYLSNGGKVIFFGKNPQLHIEPNHPEGIPFNSQSLVYSYGIGDILLNDGARLKQILHSSGISADVDPDKLSASFNGSLPNIDALIENENASVVLTYQSLSNDSPINNFDDETIAIKYEDENSSFLICGVPLYYFKEDEAKVLLKKLMEDEMMVGNVNPTLVDNQIEVYPNPIENTIHIKNQMRDRLSGLFLITDISGRVVNQFQLDIESGDVSEINVDLLPGVYFLSNTQNTIKKKLIVE